MYMYVYVYIMCVCVCVKEQRVVGKLHQLWQGKAAIAKEKYVGKI